MTDPIKVYEFGDSDNLHRLVFKDETVYVEAMRDDATGQPRWASVSWFEVDDLSKWWRKALFKSLRLQAQEITDEPEAGKNE